MKRFWIILGLFLCIALKSLSFHMEAPTIAVEESDDEAGGTSEETDFA